MAVTDERGVPARPLSRCNWCTGHIVWAVTINGKWMPLDALATVNGNVYLTVTRDGRTWRATVRTRYEAASEAWAEVPQHVHHGTTCPAAKEWWPSASPGHSKRVSGVHEKAAPSKPDAPGAPSGLPPAWHPDVEVRPVQEEMF